ncbi:hypothetical protein C0989_008304 [Termitomyces sp. Mn162]|nr:hypothetical protein C0989_008304 [Termitomyces sp. Mn162]
MALLQFDPNNPILSNWLAFIQEFSSKFGIFDTIAEAEENLFNLQMCNNEHFMTFIIQFKWEAYKTGWNYNTLCFALHCTLPQQIKDVLCLTPKQTTYNGYKALITQNTSGNTNWQARAANGTQSSIPTNPANPTLHFSPGQGTTSTNQLLEQCPPAQLNATNLHKTLEPLDAKPNNHNNVLDSANNQEALCMNKIWDRPWIDVPEDTQEK